ncbi:uncharacterized protein LOC110251537 isoform X2 [Exaiptasia diaphana]|uniref:Uncharacterized protein n=1 Tax=Exaiptasia diaphana TaxID=2652724 RepID=A0A913Y264_EXADI|nr:uncharacterized protein LOC110251537 isoform X2 [Exaiptasia diaphana]KXJ19789.1 hypothetical protein AC249_AIPGENE12067 [Exaiptasia diaphana]
MVHQPDRWSYDNQGELDALEDIFKAPDWNEPALKPALSCILAPALCAVYGATKDGMVPVGTQRELHREAEKELSCIQVNIESVDEDEGTRFFFDDDDDDDLFYSNELSYSSPSSSPSSPSNKSRPRSPELLYPPVPTLTAVKERLPVFFNYKYSSIFVSGYEAERQRLEKRTFGKHTAATLAERRSSYSKKRRDEDREEGIVIENEIDLAVESKFLQLKMADELEKQGTKRTLRRAKLWRRCAAMAEVLAKEHAEALLWKQKFEEAAGIAFGNKRFY